MRGGEGGGMHARRYMRWLAATRDRQWLQIECDAQQVFPQEIFIVNRVDFIVFHRAAIPFIRVDRCCCYTRKAIYSVMAGTYLLHLSTIIINMAPIRAPDMTDTTINVHPNSPDASEKRDKQKETHFKHLQQNHNEVVLW